MLFVRRANRHPRWLLQHATTGGWCCKLLLPACQAAEALGSFCCRPRAGLSTLPSLATPLQVIEAALQNANMQREQIDWLVMHQVWMGRAVLAGSCVQACCTADSPLQLRGVRRTSAAGRVRLECLFTSCQLRPNPPSG